MSDEQVHVHDFLQELAESTGGRINEVGALPDGSGFATMSFPLPKNHWAYQPTGEPPMPFRVGTGMLRNELAERIRAAGKYAYKASTMSGREQDLDPDALLQNLIVGLLGYWTEDGTTKL